MDKELCGLKKEKNSLDLEQILKSFYSNVWCWFLFLIFSPFPFSVLLPAYSSGSRR